MDKTYNYLLNCYRFIILGVVLVNIYQVKPTLEDKVTMVIYAILLLYGIVLSLLPAKKWIVFAEMVVVYGIIYMVQDSYLYFLLVIPVVQLLGTRLKKLDIILFTIVFSLLQYVVSGQMFTVVTVGFALFIGISLIYVKTKEAGIVRAHVRKREAELHEIKDELTNRTRELSVISKMFVKSKELNEIIEEEDVIDSFVESSGDFFNANYVALYIKQRSGEYQIEKELGNEQGYDVPDILDMSDIVEPAEIKRDMLRVPISSDDELWGVIAIYGKTSSVGLQGQLIEFPFRDDDYEMLSVYIEQVKFVIKHSKMLKKMSDLANNDFLTKIPNRRYFMSQLQYLIERAKRGESLSVMVLDIDHFKNFNDTYGHDVGDKVLKVVAEEMKDSVRKIDVVGRIGGEEFGILLPNTKNNEVEVAERIRDRIKNINFISQITISIGIANFGEHGENEIELLKNADRALYDAKDSGRDCVRVYSEK